MRFALNIVVLLLVAYVCSAGAADPLDPRERIELTAKRLFFITQTESGSDRKDRARVEVETQEILGEIVDYVAVTRGVYGKQHREKLSASQEKRFQKVFERSIVQLLAKVLINLDATDLTVQEARMSREARARVLVIVTTSERNKYQFQFSLALTDGEWRVRNFVVNGVNLGLTYRNQFAELMKTHSQNIDAVIDAWSETIVESGAIEGIGNLSEPPAE